MTPFATDQLIIIALLFLLGVLIGMFIMAGGRWKRAYHEQVRRTQELEAENNQLRADAREMESLRNAAARTPVRGAATDERP
jgi:uncharacterized membrane-anchored protein YhcB (DUF1043 family)